MKRIVIESPYNLSKEQIEKRAQTCHGSESGRILLARNQLLRENIQYARLLYKKALEEGHAPFASHLNYTQVWSEEPGFRERGIEAGFAWKSSLTKHDEVWYGADLPWSESIQNTFEHEEHWNRETIKLFPGLDESKVRAYLASLPWSAFVGVE